MEGVSMKISSQAEHEFNEWLITTYRFRYDSIERYSFDMKVGLFLRYIREERGVLIQPYNNASGYLWNMMKVDGGTDLGYSEYSGNDLSSGTFKTWDDAVGNAIELELKGGLEKFKKETSGDKFHWGNYADYLLKLKD